MGLAIAAVAASKAAMFSAKPRGAAAAASSRAVCGSHSSASAAWRPPNMPFSQRIETPCARTVQKSFYSVKEICELRVEFGPEFNAPDLYS